MHSGISKHVGISLGVAVHLRQYLNVLATGEQEEQH